MPSVIEAVGRTDVGLVRSGNEDFYLVDKDHMVYAVCDGMGGHLAGEVASMTAAQTIQTAFSHFVQELRNHEVLSVGKSLPQSGDILLKSIRLANRAIHNLGLADSAKAGMGTTVAALAFDSDMLSVVHVGDSRAYHVTADRLVPLTHDHSWVAELERNHNLSSEEAGTFVGKNVITRALGVRATVEVDYRLVKVVANDLFLLCSDGLCGFVTDEEMFGVLRDARGNLEKGVDSLIHIANQHGGSDNITAILVRVSSVESTDLPEVEVFTLEAESETVAEAEDAILLKFSETQPSDIEIESPESESGPNKLVLGIIFALFIAVAVFIVFYSSQTP